MKFRLIKKRERSTLTWFSRLLVAIVLLALLTIIFRNLDAFLSVTRPVDSKVLVLEGWLPDYTIQKLMEIYHEDNYEHLIITGLPTHKGYYVTQFNNSAEIALKSLNMFGFDTVGVGKVTIPKSIQIDRTYTTALALEEYLKSVLPDIKSVNIFTLGSHARRSRLLYKRALRPDIKVGIIAADNREYDKNKWWGSSRGFRTVSNEALGYLYVKLLFHPDKNEVNQLLHEGHYIDKINRIRYNKDQEYLDSLKSPLTSEQRQKFTGLHYFPPTSMFRVSAKFIVDTSGKVFKMKTSTDRLPEYRKYGEIHFTIDTTLCRLSVYQNVALVKDTNFREHLFLPFIDLSSGNTSYGGGRYLDLMIPEADSLEIDFNLLYNPYCSYNARWSCPVPPDENKLNVEILAGEMKFDH